MKKVVLCTFLSICLLIVVFIIKVYIAFDVEKMKKDLEERYSQVILGSKDEIIGAYLNEGEQWQIKGDEIPFRLKEAVLTFEDRDFYKHNGVDYLALMRAIKNNFVDRRKVGASTITMQSIKLYKKRERTYLSKILEMIEAYKLENYMTKDEILSVYLNNAPYGGNIVGYESASLLYFNKKAINLTWAEGALLAVLPNSPGLIHVEKNREKLLKKRDFLLKNMYERNIINKKQYELALKEPLPEKRGYLQNIAPHFTRRLKDENPNKKIIKTTLDLELQKKISKIAKDYGEYLKNRGIKNSAILVVENESKEIKAYIGSQDFYDFEGNGQVDGIVANRSVGSLLKPFLYALSMDDGLISSDSKLLDIPLYFSNFNPQNANKKYHGLVEAKEALAKSLNIPFVKLLDEYGVDKFFYFLKNVVGFRDNEYSKYGLSLILGTKEMSVEDIAKLYCGLANYGSFSELRFQKDENSLMKRKLISDGAAYLTLDALRAVARYGVDNIYTGRDGISWKTGTSYGQKDAWSAGITSKWTVVVWVGNFTGEGNRNISGVVTAGQLMFNIFALLNNEKDIFKRRDESLKLIKVDKETGYRLKYDVPYKEVEYPRDAKPLKYSPYYKKIYLNEVGKEIDSRDLDFYLAKEKIVLQYPVEFLNYLAKENIELEEGIQNKNSLKFIYPLNNLKIVLAKDFDGKKGVIIKISNPEAKKIYWYINGEYIGVGNETEKILDLKEGEQRVSIVSEDGEMAEVRFFIIKSTAERK